MLFKLGNSCKNLKTSLRNRIESVLYSIEEKLLKHEVGIRFSPIFVIGPPRSGSTLLYHLIARRFRVCYFSNFAHRFYKSPITISKLAALFDGCSPPDQFVSHYGSIRGEKAPNQGRRFWDHWIPEHPHFLEHFDSVQSKTIIRKTIAHLQQTYKAPFLNKWPRHAVRLLVLNDIFPEAVFVRIKRNYAHVALSLWNSRKKFLGNEAAWFSTKPKDHKSIVKKPPIEQVCEQVVQIEEVIDYHARLIGKQRFLNVTYNDLVENPNEVLKNIQECYDPQNKHFPLQIIHSIPSEFSNMDFRAESNGRLQDIKKYMEKRNLE